MQEHVIGGLVMVFTPADPPPPETVEELRDRALDVMRAAREPMLNAVVGILTVALADDDAATVAKAKEVRQALLDITHDVAFNAATTWEEMEAAAKLAYRRVAALVASAPQFAAVFREVTGA